MVESCPLKEYQFLDKIQDIQTLLIAGKKQEAQEKINEMIELIMIGEILVFGRESVRKYLEEELKANP